MGFKFPDNFRTPYFSQNFSEFWTRWHISLSSWLRDYLYIPLGGNRGGSFGSIFFIVLFMFLFVLLSGWWWLALINLALIGAAYFYAQRGAKEKATLFNYMNLMVTMLLGGLWHGASWAFVFWGFLHGMYLVVQRLVGPYWNQLLNALRVPNLVQSALAILIVYVCTCYAWIYFRAPDFDIANQVIAGIASLEQFHPSSIVNKFWVLKGGILIAALLLVEITDFRFHYGRLVVANPRFRVVSFAIILWFLAFFGSYGSNSFIYFQF